jgi:hypothetical protein
VYVGSNTYEQADALGTQHGGRLARWTGNMSSPWEILEETAFFEVTGRSNMGCVVFAAGEGMLHEPPHVYGVPRPAPRHRTHVWTQGGTT